MSFLPHLLSWNVTARCNLRCKHCYIDASKAMPDELTPDEALRVLGEIAEVNRETLLILSGGEPLLRPDLDALVSRAAVLGMRVVLGTNGTLLSPERAVALKERGLAGVGISLDSLLSLRHDEFRGVNGAWQAARGGIEAAREARLDLQLQMTLTRQNLPELPALIRFAEKVGARALAVFFLVCTGRGQAMVDLSPQEYEAALRLIADSHGGKVMVRPRCAPTFRRLVAEHKPDSILLHSETASCLAGKSYCRITPDGDVTPCPYVPLVAGSFRKSSFREIWESSPLLNSLRNPGLRGRCGLCEFKTLCGGCRARAFALSGDPLGEDSWCTYVPGTAKAPDLARGAAMAWTPEAESRLHRVPFFVRNMVRAAVEAFARRKGCSLVSPELMAEARQTMMKS
ncbi:MAG: radical SAM protein [Planctomycetes bacterium]|nr:radical SAM protein [Planctomycetota bacterium]